MELQRGVCSFCSENKVLHCPQIDFLEKLLPAILQKEVVSENEFQKIKNALKVCAVCYYKLHSLTEIKDGFHADSDKPDEEHCRFCNGTDLLTKVEATWKSFIDRTEGFTDALDFPLLACCKCIFYFDAVFNFKSKLVFKFPHLTKTKKRSDSQKASGTPKRKSVSNSPQSAKKRKIFDNCFVYLKPLNKAKYHVDDKLKRDHRLYKKIAYVNLKNSDIDVNETPKTRPIIKIKLKNKKDKLSKSEEGRKNLQQEAKRRHSHLDNKKEKLDETPKSAIDSVIKRRVSIYLDENKETKDEKKENGEEEKVEAEKEEASVEQSTGEAEQKVEEAVETDKKDDQVAEQTEKVDEVESKEDATVEKTDEAAEKKDEKEEKQNETEEKQNETEEKQNETEEKKDETLDTEQEVQKEKENEPEEVPLEKVTNGDGDKTDDEKRASDDDVSFVSESVEKPVKTVGNSSDSSDSESSEKDKDKSDGDVLNGSERKKKRVTFSLTLSDDIID